MPREIPVPEPQEIEPTRPSEESAVKKSETEAEPETAKITQPDIEIPQTTTEPDNTAADVRIAEPDSNSRTFSETNDGQFRSDTILRIDKPQQPETLPPISEHHDTSEVAVGPLYSFDTTKNLPPPGDPPRPVETWTNEDEIGAMRRDVMEAPEGGDIAGLILAVPVLIGKHIVGKGIDFLARRKKNNLRNNISDLIDEKSLRFLILMWRDSFVNPDLLSRSDRLFISRSATSDGVKQRHRLYLNSMKKKGLVKEIKSSGQTLYGAALTRNEMLRDLNKVLRQAEYETDRKIIQSYISLIENCYDMINNRVSIPESMVGQSENDE